MDDFIVIACDGIWDCFKNDQVAKFIRKNLSSRRIRDKKEHIKKMIGELMDKGLAKEVQSSNGIGTDNMTCIVVLLKPMLKEYNKTPPRQIKPKAP
jgi:serine/threonine protein phosphatase PrpC